MIQSPGQTIDRSLKCVDPSMEMHDLAALHTAARLSCRGCGSSARHRPPSRLPCAHPAGAVACSSTQIVVSLAVIERVVTILPPLARFNNDGPLAEFHSALSPPGITGPSGEIGRLSRYKLTFPLPSPSTTFFGGKLIIYNNRAFVWPCSRSIYCTCRVIISKLIGVSVLLLLEYD